MKKIYSKYNKFALLLGILFLVSCSEDFLTRQKKDGISSGLIFEDDLYARAYLMEIYNYIPIGFGVDNTKGFPEAMVKKTGNDRPEGHVATLAMIADEAQHKSAWPTTNVWFNRGIMSPTQMPFNNWAYGYKGIRKANLMLEGLENSNMAVAITEKLNAEARFTRAFQYFNISRRFGNIPLITDTQQGLEGKELEVAQSTQREIFDFAQKELGEIAESLYSMSEIPANEYGRATTEAAYALQARVLLYMEEWAKAEEAALKVINSDYGFEMNTDYSAYFQSEGGPGSSKETIFEIMMNINSKKHGFDFFALSDAYGGHSQFLPVQELVDAYETMDGKFYDDPTSGYDEQNPYVNRDPRLAATVIHHGMDVKGRITDHTVIRKADGSIAEKGADTRKFPMTGYWTKKFVKLSTPTADRICTQSWKELRFAEVLFIYCEAHTQAVGPDQSVYDALNLIRTREGVGLPKLEDVRPGLSKEEMLAEIEREKYIEMAFEGHRYYDIVRKGKAPELLNNRIYTAFLYIEDQGTGETKYERIPYATNGAQIWPDKYRYWPIPKSAIERNSKLVQNPGY